MAYGVRLKDASGNITVDYTDRITRMVLSFTNQQANITDEDCSGITGLDFSSNAVAIAVVRNESGSNVRRPPELTYPTNTTFSTEHKTGDTPHFDVVVFMYK